MYSVLYIQEHGHFHWSSLAWCPLCLSFRASSFLVIILPLSFFFFSFVLYLPLFEGGHQMPYTVDDVCKCKNIKLSSISQDRMRRTLLRVCIQWQSYSILTSNIMLPFSRQTSRFRGHKCRGGRLQMIAPSKVESYTCKVSRTYQE